MNFHKHRATVNDYRRCFISIIGIYFSYCEYYKSQIKKKDNRQMFPDNAVIF